MDIVLVVILLLAGLIVGWYDRYSVQRTYADLYAARHGGIPSLIDWFSRPMRIPTSSPGGAATATCTSS